MRTTSVCLPAALLDSFKHSFPRHGSISRLVILAITDALADKAYWRKRLSNTSKVNGVDLEVALTKHQLTQAEAEAVQAELNNQALNPDNNNLAAKAEFYAKFNTPEGLQAEREKLKVLDPTKW